MDFCPISDIKSGVYLLVLDSTEDHNTNTLLKMTHKKTSSNKSNQLAWTFAPNFELKIIEHLIALKSATEYI